MIGKSTLTSSPFASPYCTTKLLVSWRRSGATFLARTANSLKYSKCHFTFGVTSASSLTNGCCAPAAAARRKRSGADETRAARERTCLLKVEITRDYKAAAADPREGSVKGSAEGLHGAAAPEPPLSPWPSPRARGRGVRRYELSAVPDVHHVSVLDDVVLALEPQRAFGTRVGLGTGLDELVPADRLGADEVFLEIRV